MASDGLDTVVGGIEVGADAAAAKAAFEEAQKADEAGERDEALEHLRKAVAADPTNQAISFQLAFRMDLAGEDEAAISLYERVISQTPAPINALLNLAVLYEDHGDYASAERCLRQVLETNPNHPRARLYIKDVQASREMQVEDDPDKEILRRRAMLDTPVTDFELSVRARTCLKKMNIRTLGDLLRVTEAELMSYKNFGEQSLHEIKRMLQMKGLRLGQGLEEAHRAARRQIAEQLKGTGKEAALNKPVSDLQLSVRARRALQLLNIQSLGDLCSHTEAELMGIKNFGATSLKEVRERLTEFGLALRHLDE